MGPFFRERLLQAQKCWVSAGGDDPGTTWQTSGVHAQRVHRDSIRHSFGAFGQQQRQCFPALRISWLKDCGNCFNTVVGVRDRVNLTMKVGDVPSLLDMSHVVGVQQVPWS